MTLSGHVGGDGAPKGRRVEVDETDIVNVKWAKSLDA